MKAKILLGLVLCGCFAQNADAKPTSNDPKIERAIEKLYARNPAVIDRINIDIESGQCLTNGVQNDGCFYGNRIVVKPVNYIEFVLAHELGHAFDAQMMTVWDRSLVQHWMRDWQVPWMNHLDADPYCQKEVCPAEWFADSFQNCLNNTATVRYRPTPRSQRRWFRWGVYHAPWTPKLKSKLCNLIEQIAGR